MIGVLCLGKSIGIGWDENVETMGEDREPGDEEGEESMAWRLDGIWDRPILIEAFEYRVLVYSTGNTSFDSPTIRYHGHPHAWISYRWGALIRASPLKVSAFNFEGPGSAEPRVATAHERKPWDSHIQYYKVRCWLREMAPS